MLRIVCCLAGGLELRFGMRKELKVRFAENVRAVRIAAGLSQEQLAAKSGLHRTHISLIERAMRSIRIETIEHIAAALRIEPAHLLSTPPPVGKTRPTASSDLGELQRLFPVIREYQAIASRRGIGDIFQDNGGKILQTLLILGLDSTGSREGNDAKDASGNEYELKTVNALLTQNFSTHHHLNPTILKKYRAVHCWYFSVYKGIELASIHRLTPAQLEPYFTKWEQKWHASGGKDINNPKIPLKFVQIHGKAVYPEKK